ncbi:MAG: amidohydrolase family protein, partial [Erysipelotrichaceae bacterium]|nr:amidohydrolase family protein [Erysipelotrichaceae bacterium]
NVMMRRARNIVGLSREEVGSLYAESPAKCLNITDRGKIEVGRKSDLVLMDDDYQVYTTIIDGKVFYQK